MLNAYEQQLILDNQNVNIPVLARLIGCTPSQAANVRIKNPAGKWLYKGKGLPFTSKSSEGRYMVNYRGNSLVATSFFSKAIGCVDRLIECIDNEGFYRVFYEFKEYRKRGIRLEIAKENRFEIPLGYKIAKKSDFKR